MHLPCVLTLLIGNLFFFAPSRWLEAAETAKPNSKIVAAWQAYPSSLLFYLGFDDYSNAVSDLVLDPLLREDKNSGKLLPGIVKTWTVDKSQRIITLDIDPQAQFSDGKKITAADVEFTWKTLFDPAHRTLPFQNAFKILGDCEILSPTKVRFTASEAKVGNLKRLSEIYILPKHHFEGKPFHEAFNSNFQGSGPYRIDSAITGEKVVLRKNPTYWARDHFKDRYFFDEIIFKVVSDPMLQLELLKKRELDFVYVLSSRIWAAETKPTELEKFGITKLVSESGLPFSTVGIAWNCRNPLFSDARVRMALSHLFHREKILNDLLFNSYLPATGPFHTQSEFHSPKNLPVPYDPKRAQALLREAGWSANAKGRLEKGGRTFDFEILTANPASQRYLTLYQEALKNAGIEMKIRTADFATVLAHSRNFTFESIEVAREREREPSQLAAEWGTESGKKPGGDNLTGISLPSIDELTAKIDKEPNRTKRIALYRALDEEIGRAQPMTFLWEQHAFRVLYRNRFQIPEPPAERFSRWMEIFHRWKPKS